MTDREIAALREWAAAHDENLLLADGFEEAFLGVTSAVGTRPALALYDIARCIEILMTRDGMDYDGAEEFLSFNTLGAWMGDSTPLFLYRHDREEPT